MNHLQQRINDIIVLVKNDAIKEKIEYFWLKDFNKYLNKLIDLSNTIERNDIVKEDGIGILKEINDGIMQKCDELETAVDNKSIVKKIKKLFREFCWPYVCGSFILKRAYEKPLGYPGDYELIENIYDNVEISKNIGYCVDSYFLKNEYAVAIRNRREKMRDLLFQYIGKADFPVIKILNLACGSCREIKELLSSKISFNKGIIFSLVDQDKEALNYSENMLKNISGNSEFKFLKHNILEYIKEKDKYTSILSKQNFIYSIGLADYLPDRVLRDLLLFCFDLLEPEGQLIIAHKDIARYKPLAPDWWCDWTFYPRGENHLLKLIKESRMNNFNLSIDREPSGIIIFLTIRKNK